MNTSTSETSPFQGVSRQMRRRVIASCFIGSIIEWYDFYLYGVASAVVFAHVFFPSLSGGLGIVASFGTLAAGFVARPLGGIIIGHLGDKIGRKPVLIGTLISMGVCTALIGVLPTHHQVGILAPILLVTLRVVQGLSAGGEWGGAMTMTWEYARKGRRGLAASVNPAGTFAGLLLANGAVAVFALMPEEQFLSWGWRIPFFFSALLVVLGLWLRLAIDESPIFEKMAKEKPEEKPEETEKVPLVGVFREHSKLVLLGIFIMLGHFTASAVFNGMGTAYALQLDYTSSMTLTAVLIASAWALILQPVFGDLSDRVGRKKLVMLSSGLLVVSAFLVFPMINTNNPVMLVLAICICTTAHAVGFSGIGAWLVELFPTAMRYSGASLGYQLGQTIGGGFSPLIATVLLTWSGGQSWVVSLYLLLAALLAASTTYLLVETARGDLTASPEAPRAGEPA